MSQGVIARRYAKALINLADKYEELETTGSYMSELSEIYKNSEELRETLSDTKISIKLKQGVLKKILNKINAPALVDKFSRYLLEKRRLVLLTNIESEFNLLLQEKLGRIDAQVTLAHELPEATVDKIVKSISAYSGKDVAVSIKIDPAIIGGIVTRIGSVVIDGSIYTQLNKIQQTIIRG